MKALYRLAFLVLFAGYNHAAAAATPELIAALEQGGYVLVSGTPQPTTARRTSIPSSSTT